MMIRDSSEKELFSKQEADLKENKAVVANSRSWSGLKDPRIVRVSRLFGGKDRHSKVNTIRGLRDRRVRLSVPTAIQLYDLQDRLGLNQPSKVVDWLLKATQNEIDKLPPLQIPPGNFIPFPRSSSSIPPRPEASQAQAQALLPSFNNSEKASGSGARPATLSSSKSSDEFEDLALLSRPTLWKTGTKEVDKSSINEGNEVEHQDVVSIHQGHVYRPIHPSLSGLLHNPLSYNTSFYHYDPSVSLASHPTQEEVSHSHCHPPPILSSPYMVPSLLASYAISQNEFCNKESSHFQIQSPTTSEGLPPNTLRTSPHIGNYPMTYFHSNLAPKH